MAIYQDHRHNGIFYCPFVCMNTHGSRHRKAHPDDPELFSDGQLPGLQHAVQELLWLFNRGYSRQSAIKFVSDHHQLKQRQRTAIGRVACSEHNRMTRNNKCVDINNIRNRDLIIDGFNLIITLESAMAGSLLLQCCDGCIRDLASVHGTYRQVSETRSVIELIGRTFTEFEPASVQWIFDKPVSNSGRLVQLIRKIAATHNWNWNATLLEDPDRYITVSEKIAITSDSVILDEVAQWLNLTEYLLEQNFSDAWLIDFSS